MRISSLKTKILIFFLVVLIIFSLNFYQKDHNPPATYIKNFFYLISSPIQKTFWGAGNDISDFFTAIFQAGNLKKERDTLYLKSQELLGKLNSLEELKKENENLREALGLGLEKEFELELVRVIGKDISQDSILVNKGLEEGIVEGLPVITPEKILVGQISKVYRNFSKVKLISFDENSFSVKIREKDIQGIAKGKGNLSLSLELVPLEAELKEKDIVFTSALARIYPPGLLVGEIGEIKKSDVQPYQTAKILPAFNFDNLNQIFVILNFPSD